MGQYLIVENIVLVDMRKFKWSSIMDMPSLAIIISQRIVWWNITTKHGKIKLGMQSKMFSKDLKQCGLLELMSKRLANLF